MTRSLFKFIVIITAALASACSWQILKTETVAAQSQSINIWFEEQFERRLARSPMFQTYLGRKTDYDRWDDESYAFQDESYAQDQAALMQMREAFDMAQLDAASQLSYRLFEHEIEMDRAAHSYRRHDYEFTQMYGPHSGIPAFLINQHRIDSLEDVRAYIARLQAVDALLKQHQDNAEAKFAQDIYPPRWSYAQMIATARNVIAGQPFDSSAEPSALLADFQSKLAALELDEPLKTELEHGAKQALIDSVQPAYQRLISMFTRQQQRASDDDGAWKLPDGEAYYASRLQQMTTTNLSANDIHNLGLAEMDRIHAQMKAIKSSVGFTGSLQEFFRMLRDDPKGQFSYPNTDAGRAAYLAEATAIIDRMRARLDELFRIQPKADLIVKRVEAFREKSAGKAFYQMPAPDGSRPGIYYANLHDMNAMPNYQMEALAYHEGIPGHHMQLAIAQELDELPSFRKFGGYTAYIEGWGLYSEFIPKQMGFYADPYSDFGRLSMELWRAARLVVDTGIHAKKWSREQAIEYLVDNTPNSRNDCRRAIERYIVMPGQATAYKIGMLKILELRSIAENAFGNDFDIRDFHDVVLKDGAVPLTILEENVLAWINQYKAGQQTAAVGIK